MKLRPICRTAVILLITSLNLINPIPSPLISASPQKPDWTRYSFKDEKFSIMMPEPPIISTVDGANVAAAPVFVAYNDGVVYLVISDPRIKGQLLDHSIDRFRDRLPRWTEGGTSHSSTMEFDKKDNINGFERARYRIRIY